MAERRIHNGTLGPLRAQTPKAPQQPRQSAIVARCSSPSIDIPKGTERCALKARCLGPDTGKAAQARMPRQMAVSPATGGAASRACLQRILVTARAISAARADHRSEEECARDEGNK